MDARTEHSGLWYYQWGLYKCYVFHLWWWSQPIQQSDITFARLCHVVFVAVFFAHPEQNSMQLKSEGEQHAAMVSDPNQMWDAVVQREPLGHDSTQAT